MWTGIPVIKLTEAETQKLLRMEDELHKRVVGQERGGQGRLPRDPPRPRRPQGPASARRARSSSSAPRASARPSWPARWPSSCSATRARSSRSTCPSTWRSTRSVAPGGLAARLRRLRRGRPAHRAGPPQAVLGDPARRDREGAPGRLQHPPADPGGRTPHRRPGPLGRLPQRDHHHDLEHRRRDHLARNTSLGFSVTDETRPGLRRDEVAGHGRAQEASSGPSSSTGSTRSSSSTS